MGQSVNNCTERPYICLLRSHRQLWRLPLPSASNRVFFDGSESEVAENQRGVAMAVCGRRTKEDILRFDVAMDDGLPF